MGIIDGMISFVGIKGSEVFSFKFFGIMTVWNNAFESDGVERICIVVLIIVGRLLLYSIGMLCIIFGFLVACKIL